MMIRDMSELDVQYRRALGALADVTTASPTLAERYRTRLRFSRAVLAALESADGGSPSVHARVRFGQEILRVHLVDVHRFLESLAVREAIAA
jgi:hypothetical protein